jgi:hypothetical protein
MLRCGRCSWNTGTRCAACVAKQREPARTPIAAAQLCHGQVGVLASCRRPARSPRAPCRGRALWLETRAPPVDGLGARRVASRRPVRVQWRSRQAGAPRSLARSARCPRKPPSTALLLSLPPRRARRTSRRAVAVRLSATRAARPRLRRACPRTRRTRRAEHDDARRVIAFRCPRSHSCRSRPRSRSRLRARAALPNRPRCRCSRRVSIAASAPSARVGR